MAVELITAQPDATLAESRDVVLETPRLQSDRLAFAKLKALLRAGCAPPLSAPTTSDTAAIESLPRCEKRSSVVSLKLCK